jgi:AcrR family transcriptional regulator
MKTRERILIEALTLFNDEGYAVVTTAALAAHCRIAEGNLWYHFKTKRALLDAIGARFAARIEARLALEPQGDPVAAYARLMAVVMAEFREFRFLYRDQYAFGELPDPIRIHAPRWNEQTFVQLEAHLAALVEAGLLDWPRERLRDLAINATIVLRFGLEHFRELGEPTGEGSGVVERILLRHLTMFEHALDPAAARRLREAIAQIGQEYLAA